MTILAMIEESLAGRDRRIDPPAKIIVPRRGPRVSRETPDTRHIRTTVEIPAEVLRRLREECSR